MITSKKNNLRFPKLIKVKGELPNTYKLDWKYMQKLCDAKFMIDEPYLKNIRHFANLGNREWVSLSFDTSVRETLLGVTNEAIFNSFFLSNCLLNYPEYFDSQYKLTNDMYTKISHKEHVIVERRLKLKRISNIIN